MGAGTKRVTVYFDSALHQALRMQSAETSRSVSELVNDAVRETLAEDLAVFDERANKSLIGYEDSGRVIFL